MQLVTLLLSIDGEKPDIPGWVPIIINWAQGEPVDPGDVMEEVFEQADDVPAPYMSLKEPALEEGTKNVYHGSKAKRDLIQEYMDNAAGKGNEVNESIQDHIDKSVEEAGDEDWTDWLDKAQEWFTTSQSSDGDSGDGGDE